MSRTDQSLPVTTCHSSNYHDESFFFSARRCLGPTFFSFEFTGTTLVGGYLEGTILFDRTMRDVLRVLLSLVRLFSDFAGPTLLVVGCLGNEL